MIRNISWLHSDGEWETDYTLLEISSVLMWISFVVGSKSPSVISLFTTILEIPTGFFSLFRALTVYFAVRGSLMETKNTQLIRLSKQPDDVFIKLRRKNPINTPLSPKFKPYFIYNRFIWCFCIIISRSLAPSTVSYFLWNNTAKRIVLLYYLKYYVHSMQSQTDCTAIYSQFNLQWI